MLFFAHNNSLYGVLVFCVGLGTTTDSFVFGLADTVAYILPVADEQPQKNAREAELSEQFKQDSDFGFHVSSWIIF